VASLPLFPSHPRKARQIPIIIEGFDKDLPYEDTEDVMLDLRDLPESGAYPIVPLDGDDAQSTLGYSSVRPDCGHKHLMGRRVSTACCEAMINRSDDSIMGKNRRRRAGQ
jgi:hypothetical protein